MKLVFKEYMVINEPEHPITTKFYLKESKRIKNKLPSNKQTASIYQDEDEEDIDEEDDRLEDEFLRNQSTTKKDKRQIEKLVKKTLGGQDDEEDLGNDLGEDQAKIDEIEMQEFEKLIKNNHTNYQ